MSAKTGSICPEFPPLATSPPLPIIVVNGDKGGIGKSLIARILAAFLRSAGYLVVGFDCDARNAHLDRYYRSVMPVTRAYLRHTDGWGLLLDGWENSPSNAALLVDMPGNVGDALEREMHRVNRAVAKLNRDILHVWVIDEEEDGITLLNRVKDFAPPEKTLIVMNGRFGDSPRSFVLWHESELREEMLAAGASETFIPALQIRPRTKIARARCPFDDLSMLTLSVSEQVDFELWWDDIIRAFRPFCVQSGLVQ
ncbi:nucleotide-binding protein [Sphingobium indicum]